MSRSNIRFFASVILAGAFTFGTHEQLISTACFANNNASKDVWNAKQKLLLRSELLAYIGPNSIRINKDTFSMSTAEGDSITIISKATGERSRIMSIENILDLDAYMNQEGTRIAYFTQAGSSKLLTLRKFHKTILYGEYIESTTGEKVTYYVGDFVNSEKVFEAKVSNDLLVLGHSAGDILLGQRIPSRFLAQMGPQRRTEGYTSPNVYIWGGKGYEEYCLAVATNNSGIVNSIYIDCPIFKTAKGITIGSSIDEVKMAHPSGKIKTQVMDADLYYYIGEKSYFEIYNNKVTSIKMRS